MSKMQTKAMQMSFKHGDRTATAKQMKNCTELVSIYVLNVNVCVFVHLPFFSSSFHTCDQNEAFEANDN